MEILALDTDQTGVWNDYMRGGYARWEVGQECDVHSHWNAAEVFVFLRGRCEITVENEVLIVGAGQTVYVGPDEKHKLKSIGPEPLEMFLVVCPNHSPTHTFYREDGTPVPYDRPAPR